jgi:plastocyanin/predicted small secreted protein
MILKSNYEKRKENMMTKMRFGMLGVLTVVSLLLAACGNTATQAPADVPVTGNEMEETKSFISVSDQDASDGFVTIDDVHTTQPGWLVIHTDQDGAPGPVIGFAQVEAGEEHSLRVEINLDQATPKLFAMLHLDAGTKGLYEFPGEDVPVKDGDAIVNEPFNATLPITTSVSVEDQDASAGSVTIAEIQAAELGWIVIHTTKEGAPGPVIGFAQVEEGRNQNMSVEIDLQRATSQLFAMLHLDAGVKGEYEFPGEDVPAKVGEVIVNVPFNITFAENPSVSVRDQALNGGKVLMDRVFALEPGWLVIHIEQDGGPGPVIGSAFVEAGPNFDLEVDIDSELATPKLFAMLHLDAGTPGEYEFPGEDVPVKNGEAIVNVPFQLLKDAESTGSVEVIVLDSRFEEKMVEIPVGTTVLWTFEGSLPHTVTADDDLFDSGTLNQGASFSFTFEETGTYPYYCSLHGGPGGNGMAGTIVVTES